MRRAALVAFLICLLAPARTQAWGFEAHRFIAGHAISLLPDPLRPFFETHRAFIAERSIDPDLWRLAGFAQEPPHHFLNLDAYGAFPYADLPRDWDAALHRWGRAKLEREGLLPWRTHEMSGSLVRSFESLRTGNPYAQGDIRFLAAVVAHYVADAHVPLHAVQNHNGQLSGQTGIHSRWESELFVRARDRLRVAPAPPTVVPHERDFVFEALASGAQLVPGLLSADRDAIADRDVYDDEYFDDLFARHGPVLERRINESITAVASFIVTAWERAGRPALSAEAAPRPAPRRRAAATPRP